MRQLAVTKRPENSHIWERELHEHYVEPEWCSRRLFEVEKFDGFIHDPACGFGRICDSASSAGYGWSCADIVHRGYRHQVNTWDFFSRRGPESNIVSNPPFDIFEKFAKHALAVAHKKVALIWLVRTLPAARWLQQTPLARIYLLTPRPSMPPGHVIARGETLGGSKQDFCWLVWDRAHAGPATISWLHRDTLPKLGVA
jgi:hypothetical protein